jgi:hypothetical protein
LRRTSPNYPEARPLQHSERIALDALIVDSNRTALKMDQTLIDSVDANDALIQTIKK